MIKNTIKTIQFSEKEYIKLHQQNVGLIEKIEQQKEYIEQQKENIKQQKEYIELLKKALYSRKSEKTPKEVIVVEFNQLTLFEAIPDCQVTELENILPEEILIKEDNKTRKKKGRRKVAVNIPTREIIIELEEEHRTDENGEQLVLIGYECSERLHLVPEELEKWNIKREVWGYKDSRERVRVAHPLEAIIPKGKLTDQFIHQIVFDKFFNGMPIYRQLKSLNALGADLSKSTLSDAVKRFSMLYAPLVEAIKNQIFKSKYIHADESPLKHKSKAQNKFKNGYMFVYQDKEQAYFNFANSRSQKQIINILENANNDNGKYIGYLICDGYAGYNVYLGKRLACWAHARRKFFKIADKNPNAKDILYIINVLYKIERFILWKKKKYEWTETKFFEKRKLIRNSKSKKVIKLLKKKLLLYENCCSPKSSLGKAISYTKNLWKELQVFLEDGCLPIDNNAAERTLRSMVIGRKNWLFVGSEPAGKWAANCYSIMESCRLQSIEPRSYLEIITPFLLAAKDDPDYDYSNLTPKNVAETIKDIRKIQKNF